MHGVFWLAIQMARRSFNLGPVHLLPNAVLGTGSFGQVCRATIGELQCAAKVLHPVLVDRSNPRNLERFEQECQILSGIRHPNVVQYLGVSRDEQSHMPILLMELMDESLTHFLERSEVRLPYHVQVNINHEVALALAFLHLNQIVHRDLSSNNVLLIGEGYRAKVTDFGMSQLYHRFTGQTKCPGTPAYMPPEALLEPPKYTEKLDCFQAGVLMIQTITRKFPDPGPAMISVLDHRYPAGRIIEPVPEIKRRHNHLKLVSSAHPMMSIALNCLKDLENDRLSAQQICHHLSALKESAPYRESKENVSAGDGNTGVLWEKEELIAQLKQDNEDNWKTIEELRSELLQKKEEIRDKEREREGLLREIRERNAVVQEKEKDLEALTKQVRDVTLSHMSSGSLKEDQDTVVDESKYTCQVSGLGLHTAIVNQEAHVTVRICDSQGKPIPHMSITAELLPLSKDTPMDVGKWLWSKKLSTCVRMDKTALYNTQWIVSYTAVGRGHYNLHIHNEFKPIEGSPFAITVYSNPTQVGHPVSIVSNLTRPYGVAVNSHDEIVVTEFRPCQVSVLDHSGKKLRTFGSPGDEPGQMISPAGVAIDNADAVFVTSQHKIQKFCRDGELIKNVGRKGAREAEFNNPCGIAVHKSLVYVCDRENHRIQVFDLDLNFIGCIGKLQTPLDVAFDFAGNMYVAVFSQKKVAVMDSDGHYVRDITHKKLGSPTGVHVVGQYLYVSDHYRGCIAVFETSGQFVTSFGREGQGKGEFNWPYCCTSCSKGLLYVCDSGNHRIQVF